MSQFVFESLLYGSQLALIALGMTLIYGVSKFANVAQADYATLGGYGLVAAVGVVGGTIVGASAVSVVSVGIVSILLYKFLFARLLRRGSATAMIGSLAVSIVIRATIQTVAGPDPQRLDLPLERGIDIMGALITPTELTVMTCSIVVTVATLVLIRFTPLGRQIRAVSSNEGLAAASGINTRRVVDVVWFLCGALGATAGVLLAINSQVHLEMGFQLLLPVFAAAIVGGFGSAGGAVIASYLLAAVGVATLKIDFGALLGLGDYMLPTGYRPATAYLVLLVVLLVRPQGLFGRRVRRG